MLKKLFLIARNMGFRYMVFRIWYELKKRTGILRRAFPETFKVQSFLALSSWKETAAPFFFNSKEDLGTFHLSDKGRQKLKEEVELIKNGKLKYFSAQVYSFGASDKNVQEDWLHNPDSGFTYPLVHWTKIPDYDPVKGDIKYVWEKSRFSFIYTLIRYEHHFEESMAALVFSKIDNWLDKNPPNMGPNYVCSQETSLRCLNWIFALYYYRNSSELTEERFQRILNSIWIQAHHVEKNINFSRIAVRNNHAITETLFLYLVGLLFEFYPEAERWKNKGKRFFEQEILYQIYKDGSYLQYSMNYQRVVMQLCTWALVLARNNKESFSKEVEERINKSSNFLIQCVDAQTGYLPNYGANDGALFFPFNSTSFRNYKGQLNPLIQYFKGQKLASSLVGNHDEDEDGFWYYGKSFLEAPEMPLIHKNSLFTEGGYATIKGIDYFSFIRCGSHPNRPSQADNLHVDLWHQGQNIFRDGGSYKYNASEEDIKYFFGSASHNVVMIESFDQMQKGPRFVWFNWTKAMDCKLEEEEEFVIFEGSIEAFGHVDKNIRHTRIVKQHKTKPYWEIEDKIIGVSNRKCRQIWNPIPELEELGFTIKAWDETGKELDALVQSGWFSEYYGKKEAVKQVVYESDHGYFKTVIGKRKSD